MLLPALILLLYLVVKAIVYEKSAKNYVCAECYSTRKPKQIHDGSTAMEIILWIFVLPFGFFYTMWRGLNPRFECKDCHSKRAIKRSSPRGQEIMAKINK